MSFFDRGPSLVKIFLAEGGVEGMVDTHDAPFLATGAVFFPRSRLFVHFHTTMPKSPPNPSSIHQVESIQSVGSVGSVGSVVSVVSIASIHSKKKEHSLLVLPSVQTIINFATEFFEMFTKKQSEHPQKVFQVFQVFRVFQVFHFAFGPQNRPVLVQIRTKPTNRYSPTSII